MLSIPFVDFHLASHIFLPTPGQADPFATWVLFCNTSSKLRGSRLKEKKKKKDKEQRKLSRLELWSMEHKDHHLLHIPAVIKNDVANVR